VGYREVYEGWRADPEAFWMKAAEAIDWVRPPSRALDDANAPFYGWYADARCNVCWNAVDRHVEAGAGARTAIIYDSPMTGAKQAISYAALRDQVASLAGALAARGVARGDWVIVYMPMIPEALVAMLACARLGAIHSVVFGGFAARELAARIDDAKPRLVLTASCGIEPGRTIAYKPLIDAAIGMAAHKPETVIVLQRPEATAGMTPGRDLDAVIGVADEIKGGAARTYLPQPWLRARSGRHRARMRSTDARADRAGRLLQVHDRRGPHAQDPVGQDPARSDVENRGRAQLFHACDDRRPVGAGRNRRSAGQIRTGINLAARATEQLRGAINGKRSRPGGGVAWRRWGGIPSAGAPTLAPKPRFSA
jgi:hypothetical protein